MQRARRTPAAGRALLALVCGGLLALAGLLLPAGAAQAAAPGAPRLVGAPSAPPALAARQQPRTAAGHRTSTAGAASTDRLRGAAQVGPVAAAPPAAQPLVPGTGTAVPHLVATPPTAVGLDVRSPRAGPPSATHHVLAARPAAATSSRAPPTGR